MSAPTSLNGRRAEAARNDRRILDAARAVYAADPDAPIAAVAERAGVGIGALYRRYRNKDDLLQRLCLDGLQRYIAEAEAALADDRDPWTAFAAFMHRALDAGAGTLTVRFAGTFTAGDELNRAARAAHAITQQLLDRAKAAGALRAGIEVGDISLLLEQLQSIHADGDRRSTQPLEQLQSIHADGDRRSTQLRRRYLALILDALHNTAAPPLPGPPPTWQEISSRYTA